MADHPYAEPVHSAARLGRRIALVVVAAAIAYPTVAAVVSVIPQVFTPAVASVPGDVDCTAGLRALRDELLTEAGTHVATGGGPAERPIGDLDDELAAWDARHRGLRARCRADRHTWHELERLRHRLALTIDRFDAEEGALARSLSRALGPPAGGPGPDDFP